jgi:hypothetical protein
MKKITILLAILLSFSGMPAFAGTQSAPSLLFSDLTSGPAAGGRDNLGAIVTIVGRNFGSQQGNGCVTVGGAKAAAYLLWSDTKISFQPGSAAATGELRVITDGGTSNALSFTVRSGNIYFVDDTSPGSPGSGTFADPWRNHSSFISRMQPGDILYFRGGTYTSNIVLTSGHTNGVAGKEIAFIGYPGELPRISSSLQDFDFQDNKQYFIVAGFKLYSGSRNISVTASHIRIVNNDIEGLKSHAYGMIHPTIGSDIKIYGNSFSGATSGDKLDHPIYVGYGADNVDIGWNHIYNNNVDRGPLISVNIDGAQQGGYKFENIRIHDNRIESNGARSIGIVCTQAGSSVYIYNNIFTGNSQLQTVYQYSGSLHMYNNIFYGSPGAATIQLTTMSDGSYTYWPETVDIKNNIIYNRSGGQYFEIVNENQMGSVTIKNNNYYGAGAGPSRDTGAVNADPGFLDAANGNFMLAANSPCVNGGADVTALLPVDIDGYSRLQGTAVDIGPYEYAAVRAVAGNNGATVTPAGDSAVDSSGGPAQPPAGVTVPLNDILVLGATAGRGTVNPSQGETAKIYFRGARTGTYHARIFTLAGDLAWEQVKQNVSEGMFEWVPKGMASAIYIVHVEGPGMKMMKKLAILK